MKNITNKKINIGSLTDFSRKFSQEKSMWQKSLFIVAIVTFIIFVAALGYLLFRPIDKKTKEAVDANINAANITFDKKTLDNLKSRQQPEKSISPVIGKNPFLPF